MKDFQQSAIEWMQSIQYLLNYFTVVVASLAGGCVEVIAHLRAGNGYELGIALSFVSVAALTVAALTGDKWAWGFYGLQLIIGVSQMDSLPNALLSIASLPAAYAAGTMLGHVMTTRRTDKADDNELTKSLAKIDADKEVKIAKATWTSKANRSDGAEQPNSKRDYSEAQNMRTNGLSLTEIAKITGWSRTSISDNTVRPEHLPNSQPNSQPNTNGVYTT